MRRLGVGCYLRFKVFRVLLAGYTVTGFKVFRNPWGFLADEGFMVLMSSGFVSEVAGRGLDSGFRTCGLELDVL